MRRKVCSAIEVLGQITSTDLDECTVEELVQFQFWLSKHQGAVFVKTVGRLSVSLDEHLNPKDGASCLSSCSKANATHDGRRIRRTVNGIVGHSEVAK